MTGLDPLGPAAPPPSTAASKAKVDYDAFLQLLVAEMKNQDPTEPMDSTKFISQLASFSNVEQGIQTNEKLDALLSANALSASAQIVGQMISQGDQAPGEVAKVVMESGAARAILVDGRELELSAGWVLHNEPATP